MAAGKAGICMTEPNRLSKTEGYDTGMRGDRFSRYTTSQRETWQKSSHKTAKKSSKLVTTRETGNTNKGEVLEIKKCKTTQKR